MGSTMAFFVGYPIAGHLCRRQRAVTQLLDGTEKRRTMVDSAFAFELGARPLKCPRPLQDWGVGWWCSKACRAAGQVAFGHGLCHRERG